MTEPKKTWLLRILVGGALGAVCYMALAALVGNLDPLGPATPERLRFSMTTFTPRWLGTLLDYLLWAAFGAEIGVATLPFDDRGWALALKSLAHFTGMLLTVSLWACLEFCSYPLSVFIPRDLPGFLLPVAVIYAAVWGIRWLVWHFELNAIKAKLGLMKKREDPK